MYCIRFYARSQNWEKRLLASSRPPVHLSVHPHRIARLPLYGFSWNFIFEYFSKNCRGNSSFIKIGYFTIRPVYIFWSYLAQFFLEWEMFQTEVAQKIKTNILFSVILYCRAGQATYDNKATHTISNIYCFSTTTTVSQTRLIVMLLRTLSVLLLFGNMFRSTLIIFGPPSKLQKCGYKIALIA
jgi:hypothetical protein